MSSTLLALPVTIVTKRDFLQMLRELEAVDNSLTEKAIRARTAGEAVSNGIEVSEQLADFLQTNRLSLDDARLRSQMIHALHVLKDGIPTIHITFASAADQRSLQQIVAWLRSSIHVQAVITVGLQPSLIGGVYIRTANRVFDFSIRSQLANHRGTLVKELEAISGVN